MDTFSGEICRWTDETDDVSQIPERHADQAERIELQQETLKEVEKTGQPEEGTDRVKNYLENVEKKIEIRRNMEKKISESEKELT